MNKLHFDLMAEHLQTWWTQQAVFNGPDTLNEQQPGTEKLGPVRASGGCHKNETGKKGVV